ncbi:hypothetical protein BCR32DRAFT_280976 [Anaeromyces robustus]|uniref:Uncharacterized protein n=1 Tax=Anaeromyces robustus TaxID=1754192 RepID=A0A1Y1X288_9FUNG|nr:hypothetical protein BCR32DRAFT_280976 [Anaeromyces robustus]|eukprot:ORX79921.1 hypothetical protein BCR32DRAFT_280976 [Anaeromyces robustus]
MLFELYKSTPFKIKSINVESIRHNNRNTILNYAHVLFLKLASTIEYKLLEIFMYSHEYYENNIYFLILNIFLDGQL